MACRSSFEEDLSCPVCCDIFINPVVLSCSHSICNDCVQRFWGSKRLKECPVCRRRSSKEHPPVNLALKNLCESYQQKLSRRSSFGGESVCGLHKEKLKLFCLDDQEPVCLVCRDSRKHADHRFSPVDEAVMDNKEILKDVLEHLEEKRRIFECLKECFNEDYELEFNAQYAERRIKAEFEELHQFLRDEEAARITTLREEEKRRSRMMKQKMDETSRQISSLSCTIRDVEEQMNADDVSFLQNFNATLQRARCNLQIPEPNPAVTISFSNHLTNLKLTVLQKMQDNVESSYFNINSSHIQSDLAAMAISDNPEEHNEYEHFPRDGGNGTEIFGGQRSNEDLQQFPWKVHPVCATNFFPTLVGTTDPTHNLPTFRKRLPPSQITHSHIMTNYGRKLVAPAQSKSLFRWQSVLSPLKSHFGAGSPSTHTTVGGNPLQVDLRFLTFRGADFSHQDMVICDNEVQK
ncbi:E3 ubiquitin-protein ligase TRIM35-like [Onychostoma macrolepis]|uniref:Uncharacterized protein n=1 Tax=Onychostoma macrolepis TaxID=369639 RepID=A0A7J6BVH6_9TELE|nr:E3 ubiquitin-protein ligase TRIM35-like [Onychostoma macrolepis]KAF4098987.1 hypothetical protein G5714_021017 [Onychostoma macrolepis]